MNTLTRYFYNPSVTDARYTHQDVTSYTPDDPAYADELDWALATRRGRQVAQAGDVIRDPFNRYPDFSIDSLEAFLTYLDASRASCLKWFLDDTGTLHKVRQTGAFEYAPLEHDGQHDFSGINWTNAWFFTQEAAEAFERRLRVAHDKPKCRADLGTWFVHYHRAETPVVE